MHFLSLALLFLPSVHSSALFDDPGRRAIDASSSNTANLNANPQPNVRDGAGYVAIAKDPKPDTDASIQETTQFIKDRLLDPDHITISKDQQGNVKTWSDLHANSTALEEIRDHGAISRVYQGPLRKQKFRRDAGRPFKKPQMDDEALDRPKSWVAVAKNPDDTDGTAKLTDFIKSKIPDVNQMVIARDLNGDEDGKIVAWGALTLDPKVADEIRVDPGIDRIYQEDRPKKQLSISGLHRQSVQRRAKDQGKAVERATVIDKRAVNWYKASHAPDSLIAISQYDGAPPLSDMSDYVYETHRGGLPNKDGVYIYIIEEGIQLDVRSKDGVAEFPNQETPLQTTHSINNHKDPRTDEDKDSHGTTVASIALGHDHGVAKGAILVSVKWHDDLIDMARAFFKVVEDIATKDRQNKAVVVSTIGGSVPSDPDNMQDEAGINVRTYIKWLLDNGVPVVTPAGNDRMKNRPNVDFWPSNFESENFPIIVVGEVDDGFEQSEESQGGDHVTTWAMTYPAEVMFKDGTSNEEAGTSLAAGAVAGVIAQFMAYDSPPWGVPTGLNRAKDIRTFMKTDPRSGWRRKDSSGKQIGERTVWNNAVERDHASAQPDPLFNDASGPSGPSGESKGELNCRKLETRKFGRRDSYESIIDSLCQNLVHNQLSYGFDGELYRGEMRWIKISMTWERGDEPEETLESCKKTCTRILDECDTEPENKMGWKAGGNVKRGGLTFSIEPQKYREPWVSEPKGGCTLKESLGEAGPIGSFEIWGLGWSGDVLPLNFQGDFVGRLSNGPSLVYETNDQDHREWTFKVDVAAPTEVETQNVEGWIKQGVAWNDMGFLCRRG